MAADGRAAKSRLASRLEFSRTLDDWFQFVDPRFLSLVDDIQPEIVHVGFYGADFWALGHVPQAAKDETQWPEPVDGDLKACGNFWGTLNRELHKRESKAVGHFDIEYHPTGLIDGPEGPRRVWLR